MVLLQLFHQAGDVTLKGGILRLEPVDLRLEGADLRLEGADLCVAQGQFYREGFDLGLVKLSLQRERRLMDKRLRLQGSLDRVCVVHGGLRKSVPG